METVVHESTKMYGLVDRIALKSTKRHYKNIKIGLGVVEAARSSLVTQTSSEVYNEPPNFFYFLANPCEISRFRNIKNGLVLPCFEG